ncbi:MAG: hypothetical protein PHC69_06575 [Ruminiclostridium sp.]|nr:hypothetical protein [Ruminiclostridium sp.]
MNVKVNEIREFSFNKNYKKIFNQSFFQQDDKMVMTVYDPYDEAMPGYSIVMSSDYSYVEYTPHIKEYEHYDLQWLMHPFEGKVLYKGGIVLHGAAIEHNGKGIIFTGISGSGKTTQAHLWQKYREALIINGDCPLVKINDGVLKVYGTPWCGTSGEAINRGVSLDAVVLVNQGERDVLKELYGSEAFLALLANVLHSNFDKNSLDLAIENLKGIISKVRVFECTFTISEKAVKILENEIM